MKDFTISEYLHGLERERAKRALFRLPLRDRVEGLAAVRLSLEGMLEDIEAPRLAAWEACGGNGGER